jgi:RNA polymerase sigma factor (sigma-70 family)
MNDQKIIQELKAGKRQKSFVQLYKGFPVVKKLIQSKGGTAEQAEDVFQEALIIFYKKASAPAFELTASISTYVYSVARFLWKDELKKNGLKYDTAEVENLKFESELEEIAQKEKKFQVMEEVLNSIGEKCLEILQLFYYKGFSMKEIARQVDLKSEKVAKNQKYKCLERARKRVFEIQTVNA